MFTVQKREAVRRELLRAAQADPRITGGAITGSASVGKPDRWSDIDLAFGVRDASEVKSTLADFSERMYRDHAAIAHLDVLAGTWIYRVFLLPNTLQVDLAFAPAADFGARGPTFQLVFGEAIPPLQIPAPNPEEIIGWAWLYALHARSCIARGKFWQAEHMVSGMRDRVLTLACTRHGLPARDGRGFDGLPTAVTAPVAAGLVRSLDTEELGRAFRVVMEGLVREIRIVDKEMAARLEGTLWNLTKVGKT